MNLVIPGVDRVSDIYPLPKKVKEIKQNIIQPVENIKLCYKELKHEFHTEDLIELIKYAKNIRKLEKFYG